MNRIDALFRKTRDERRLAFLPFLTAGYPGLDDTPVLAGILARAGADGFEIGVPFSDPIADGPTVQRSTAQALRNGMTMARSLDAAASVRSSFDGPILAMGYFNPFYRFGIDRLCDAAAERGIDGFIVPDLPLEEAAELKAASERRGLHLVLLVAPTSMDDRLRRVGELATGFVYCVSLRGVTGARAALAGDLPTYLDRVRRYIRAPIVVGFGISRPEHVAELRGQADGVIVASSILDLIDVTPREHWADKVGAYVASLAAATKEEAAGGPAGAGARR